MPTSNSNPVPTSSSVQQQPSLPLTTDINNTIEHLQQLLLLSSKEKERLARENESLKKEVERLRRSQPSNQQQSQPQQPQQLQQPQQPQQPQARQHITDQYQANLNQEYTLPSVAQSEGQNLDSFIDYFSPSVSDNNINSNK